MARKLSEITQAPIVDEDDFLTGIVDGDNRNVTLAVIAAFMSGRFDMLGTPVLPPSNDCNQIVEHGIYTTNGNTLNSPGSNRLVLHMQDLERAFQVAGSAAATSLLDVKFRELSGAGWSLWIPFWHGGNTLALGATAETALAALGATEYTSNFLVVENPHEAQAGLQSFFRDSVNIETSTFNITAADRGLTFRILNDATITLPPIDTIPEGWAVSFSTAPNASAIIEKDPNDADILEVLSRFISGSMTRIFVKSNGNYRPYSDYMGGGENPSNLTTLNTQLMPGNYRFQALNTATGAPPNGTNHAAALILRATAGRSVALVFNTFGGPHRGAWIGNRTTDEEPYAWREFVLSDRIVGTVTQAAGVPTGSLMQANASAASPAGGYTERLANGMQTVHHSMNSSDSADSTWTYNSAFLSGSTPAVFPQPIGDADYHVRVVSRTATACVFSIRDSGGARVAVPVDLLARGRWSNMT